MIDVNFNNIINKCLNSHNAVGDGMLLLYMAYIGQAWKHIKQEGGSEKKCLEGRVKSGQMGEEDSSRWWESV